jgi:hypothetical protein
MGLAKLAKLAFNGADLNPIWQQLIGRFATSEADVTTLLDMCSALMDMCLIDQFLNNTERGMALQAQALESCRLYQAPAGKSPARLKVLGFATAGIINTNTPIEFLIEDSAITLYLLYLVPGKPLPPIPEHDIAIVLIAESDKALPLLRELECLVADWPRPVLNPPALIPQVGRERLHKVLASIAGIDIPATICVDRTTLASVGSEEIAIESLLPDGGFPLIVRPVGSHAGQGLEKIDHVAGISAYLSAQAAETFYLSRFVDYRGADGLYRKYRIAVIDGEAFPCHMAVSSRWMVHYLNAGMLESAEKRAEEERFMNRFHEEFKRRHGQAIAAMADATALDYFGIDCGETPDGKLLVFEASTALVVHNMDDPNIFPYKVPHMHAVFEAFQAFLYRRSKTAGACPARRPAFPG